MSKISVVACVIEREGRLLICQRAVDKRHGGLWEFPGGKIEPGETECDAVVRELEEELGVIAREVGPVIYSVDEVGSQFLLHFLPVHIEGEPACIEHAALAWVPEKKLLSYALAPSDRHFVEFRIRVGERA